MPDPGLALVVGLAILAVAVGLFLPERGLVARWRRSRPPTDNILRQDALKFALQREIDRQPTTREGLAERLGAGTDRSASIVTSLVDTGFLTTTAETIQLTPDGRALAAQLLRAHRLWERHLAERTGFAEAEWHDLADREEHRLTSFEAEALARDLGQPARDPHGDPIPTALGEIAPHPGVPIRSLAPGTSARITHIEDEPPEVYREIVAAGLAVGAIVRVTEASPDHVQIQVNGDQHRLRPEVADNLAVIAIAETLPAESLLGRPLDSLRPGERAVVVELSPRCRGAERRRMLDLGVLPGTVIEAVMSSPGGDPTAYRIRDAMIALRRHQAHQIRISMETE